MRRSSNKPQINRQLTPSHLCPILLIPIQNRSIQTVPLNRPLQREAAQIGPPARCRNEGTLVKKARIHAPTEATASRHRLTITNLRQSGTDHEGNVLEVSLPDRLAMPCAESLNRHVQEQWLSNGN